MGGMELDMDLEDFEDYPEPGLQVTLWDLDEISQPPSETSEKVHYAHHPIVVKDLEWRTGAPDIKVCLEDGVDEAEDSHSIKVEAANGEDEHVTYEGRTGAGVVLRYRGAIREVAVRSPREHELSGHMLVAEEKDMSAFLQCPMPGTLISCAVQEGDFVEEGQELAVVEAMKMQNVLRAESAGQIAKVNVAAGQHLKVDQVILEFVQDEAAGEAA
jgi:acetyl/propionyl-CoA carboxylase alpha subunit